MGPRLFLGLVPLLVLLALGALVPSPAHGQPLEVKDVPPALQAWIPWVLRGAEQQRCPDGPDGEDGPSGNRVCAWAGQLRLEIDRNGGSFAQQWEVFAESQVALPGDAARWPVDVRLAAGGPPAVIDVEGQPMVRLPAGRHQISGRFVWPTLPETLKVPATTGLVSLRLEGRAIPVPRRDEAGTLFLGAGNAEGGAAPATATATASDSLEIDVQRKLIDDLPALLSTRLVLRVAGKPREVLLGQALPEGFLPQAVDSPLPLRLEADGRVRVQVRAGSWTILLEARHPRPLASIGRPAPGGPWKQEAEIWVFEARPHLRVVTVDGAPPVNSAQVDLPDEWRRLPAYLLAVGARLRLNERSRGDAQPAADELHLTRRLWLDFDGGGFSVRDRIAGRLSRSWRLETGPELALGRVAVGGADQFITRLTPDGSSGVEVRQAQLDLNADSRLGGSRSSLPAVGWRHDVKSLSATLALPPGWRLLHASGADQIETTWIKRWTLLDLFLVTVLVLASARLFGRGPALLALVTMLLILQEPGAPAWIWLAVLLGEALVRALPAGRLRKLTKLYRLGAALALVIVALPFAAGQARRSLHAALETRQEGSATRDLLMPSSDESEAALESGSDADGSERAAAAPRRKRLADRGEEGQESESAAQDKMLTIEGVRAGGSGLGRGSISGVAGGTVESRRQALAEAASGLGGISGLRGGGSLAPSPAAPPPAPASAASARAALPGLDPDARIQTGPGLPTWQWREARFSWNGPVEQHARLTLWLVPPWLVGLLGLAGAALVVVLSLLLLRGGFSGLGRWLPLAGGLALLTCWPAPPAQAQAPSAQASFPPKELLDELRTRLLQKPACAPDCASFGRLAVEATPQRLRLRLEVAAAAAAVVDLPGLAQQWAPDLVLVDGRPATSLRRDDQGRLWLLLAAGGHQVVLEGPVPDRPTIQIPFGDLRPHLVTASLRGFTLSGVDPEGGVDDALELVRAAGLPGAGAGDRAGGGSGTPGELAAVQLPAFLLVERTLQLGLQWRVHTRVVRQTPPGAAVVLEVPLLPQESVLTPQTKVVAGKVQVNMGPDDEESAWDSALTQHSPIQLRAPTPATSYSERWLIEAAPVWHLGVSGIPPEHPGRPRGDRVRAFRPWPGEAVTIVVSRPGGTPGNTFTIDSSRLALAPGVRSTSATLTLALRSSRGGVHILPLPEGSLLESFRIDGREQPPTTDGQRLSIPLVPGAQQVTLALRTSPGLGPLFRTPALDLGAPSVNHDLQVSLPADRWVLLVGGPRLGPAVLVWSVMLILVLVALFLGRSSLTPLKTRQWIVLGIGFAPLSIWASAIVAGYLFALGWRRDRLRTTRPLLHDLVQVLLVLWTVVALVMLFAVIQQGLLSRPDMDIVGNGLHATDLRWYTDRAPGPLARAWVLSLPLLVYQLAMLAWALWLAFSLLRWSMWAWSCFTEGGLWRPLWPRRPPATPPPPATGSPPG